MKFLITISALSLFFLLNLYSSQNFSSVDPLSQNSFILYNIEEVYGFPPSNQPSPEITLEDNPAEYIEELHYQGHKLDNEGKYEEAISVFDELLSIDKDYTHGLTGKGWVYLHLGNYQEALNWFDRTLAIDNNFYFALTGKAVALTNLSKYQDAITWYDKALSINPNDEEIKSKKDFALSKINE